ncbi:MAG TPA: hypothetical protein VJS18_14670 [Paraburkholderia sp.]|nr:hypothetical protein [Paraburkholderia sp.]
MQLTLAGRAARVVAGVVCPLEHLYANWKKRASNVPSGLSVDPAHGVRSARSIDAACMAARLYRCAIVTDTNRHEKGGPP